MYTIPDLYRNKPFKIHKNTSEVNINLQKKDIFQYFDEFKFGTNSATYPFDDFLGGNGIPKDVINIIDEYVNHNANLFEKMVHECVDVTIDFMYPPHPNSIISVDKNKAYIVIRKILYEYFTNTFIPLYFNSDIISGTLFMNHELDIITLIINTLNLRPSNVGLDGTSTFGEVLISFMEQVLYENYLILEDVESPDSILKDFKHTIDLDLLPNISSVESITNISSYPITENTSKFVQFKISDKKSLLLKKGFESLFPLGTHSKRSDSVSNSEKCWVLIGVIYNTDQNGIEYRLPNGYEKVEAINNGIHVIINSFWTRDNIANLFMDLEIEVIDMKSNPELLIFTKPPYFVLALHTDGTLLAIGKITPNSSDLTNLSPTEESIHSLNITDINKAKKMGFKTLL